MLITLAPEAPSQATQAIMQSALAAGVVARLLRYDDGMTVIGLDSVLPAAHLESGPWLSDLVTHKPYMLASLESRPHSIVRVGSVEFGGETPVVIAGPCVIENREQLVRAAMAVKSAGATMLRGGAYKPRTSPYSFQGLGEEGLQLLAHAREITGLPVVTEVLEPDQAEVVAEYADMLQIGTRNMANTPLLKRVGKTGKPVLLKRGFSATVEEWLLSAEYLLAAGNPNVVLCERGIRSFDTTLRFTLDLSAVPLVRELSHLPVIVDPSHGTGKRSIVSNLAIAGLAAGAAGLIIESEPDPDAAKCDAYQTIDIDELTRIVSVGEAVWRLARQESHVGIAVA